MAYEAKGDECSHMILPFRLFSIKQFNFPIEHENKNTTRTEVPFRLSPDPLLRVLSNLRVSNVPPPPGRGRSKRRSICGEREAGLLVRLFPVPCCSLAIARSLLLSDPQAGGAIAIRAVFVSSFSCVIR